MRSNQQLRFASTRDGRLAYQTWGEGPDIIAIPPFAQNIETAWEIDGLRRMFNRFGSFSRYTHFDKRGVGASDRGSRVVELDQRVDDLRAVMDAIGAERASFFAQSEGGPMALLFAATYPDRVDRIVLHGSSPRLRPDDIPPERLQEGLARQRAFADAWGTPESQTLEHFAPTLAADDEFAAWWPTYERSAASRDAVLEMFAQNLQVDVTGILAEVRAPVLMLHRLGDRTIPIEEARAAVEQLPDARLIELEGDDHFCFVGGLDWIDDVERFLTGQVSAPPAVRARRVEIVTLGTLAVVRDGETVPVSAWGSKRARTLLARLAVARGWPVPREELMDMLWPDETDTSKLSARLSVLLSNVRRVLGGGVIADRQTVALDLGEVDLDLVEVDRLDDPATIVDRLQHEFSPADRYEPWAEAIRTELDARLDQALRTLEVDAGGDPVETARLAAIRERRQV